MKDKTLFSLLITGITISWATTQAWTGADHQQMLRQARTRLPLEMRLLFSQSGPSSLEEAWDRGAVKPDRELHDYANHVWHVEPDARGRRYGKAPAKVESEVRLLSLRVNAGIPLKQLAEDLGTASHYVADINNPLHTATDPKEKRIHSRYERNFERWGSKEWRFDGYDYHPTPAAWIKSAARRSNQHYQEILNSYQGEGFKKVAAVSAACYDQGINDIVDLFYNVYLRSGSQLYRYPQLRLGGPQFNINTATGEELSQIYYIDQRLANRLVRYRERHQGFRSLKETLNVKGMSRKRLQKIDFLLTLD